MGDQHWMYHRLDDNDCFVDEFKFGVEYFLDFAFSQSNPKFCSRNRIRCPCRKCMNGEWHRRVTVQCHLIDKGFMNRYVVWLAHGEQLVRNRHQWGESSRATPFVMEEPGNDPIREMVMDAISSHGIEYNMNDQASDQPIFEEAIGDVKEFFDLLQAANTPLYEGCDEGDTVLKWVSHFMNAKTLYNMSVANWDYVLKCNRRWIKPEDRDRISKDFYSAKKIMRRFSLSYKKYDVCVNNCFLYYGEYEDKNYITCLVCGEPRYKEAHVQQNQYIPRKSLWYLPITPRLKRLYMCRKTAERMTWHLTCSGESKKIVHPTGAEAWKHFDRTYPDFASDPRNVRLGLCTDGFTPFGHTATPYSCWPVFFTVYNLPPAMCMKPKSIFLSLIIQGPQSPRKNIDVMLRPLIDELKELWYNEVQTYDRFRHQHFIMRAALMWTITGFPAYGMLSGWSTHGRLSCPYCQENFKAFHLPNGRKISFFDCHRQFLPLDHPFRKNRNDFRKGHVENDAPPERLLGDDMFRQIQQLLDILFGKPSQRQCVNMQEAKVNRMKSHDCHIFMQSLLPIAFRDFLPKQVWEALTEISEFFRTLCSPAIRVIDMEIWHTKIIETICQLERIFPPPFFDSMEHLAIHLPYEAMVGGPVQFRWMYPFERRMHGLKGSMKNKARPEGSICENYMSEILYFISLYFEGEVETRSDRIPRNLVGLGLSVNIGLSIFNNLGKPIGSLQQQRVLTMEERNNAMYYVLMNCAELKGWIE
ncbi:hypothetical protein SLEP1_g27595 [Rubroshorea leprosula]|uniref:Transposase n=1 Tax=Rubroshorea leprosula TaxID=152421 RepID=A0AAV5JZM4_9ROSI|nr:hypothetical protein SLEP1_g27595 [Rubroshorea leprosula]